VAVLLTLALGVGDSAALAQSTDLPSAARARAAATAGSAGTESSPPIAGRVDPATYRVGPGDEFALRSDLQGAMDPALADYGKRSSAYLLRTQEYGSAGYDDVSKHRKRWVDPT